MQTMMTLDQETASIVKSSLEMKRKALQINLGQYRKRLRSFEQEHGMTSEQFTTKFQSGELGDQPNWFEWEFVLDAKGETERQLKLLESISL